LLSLGRTNGIGRRVRDAEYLTLHSLSGEERELREARRCREPERFYCRGCSTNAKAPVDDPY